MAVPDDFALGKLPKKSDSRTLNLSLPKLGLLTRKVAAKDTVIDETAEKRKEQSWDPLGNKDYKDCAFAAAGYAEMIWALLYGKSFGNPTEDRILDAYSKVTGFKADDKDTDNGADLLTVLKFWQNTGIADQRITAFAEVIPDDLETLKWTIASFGVAYVGLQLPSAWQAPKKGKESDKQNFETRRRLLDPATWQNRVNGHCVIYTGYSPASEFTCVSWGLTKKVSRAFHLHYCDEAYTVIPPEPAEGMVGSAKLQDLKAALGQFTDLEGAVNFAKDPKNFPPADLLQA
jgi:hypothetical protein